MSNLKLVVFRLQLFELYLLKLNLLGMDSLILFIRDLIMLDMLVSLSQLDLQHSYSLSFLVQGLQDLSLLVHIVSHQPIFLHHIIVLEPLKGGL